jgi:two-component system CheB/CheR fusion protein
VDPTLPPAPGRLPRPARLPLRELTERALLQQVAPAAALVTASGEILYLHGRTGRYLEPAPGEAGASHLLRMAREGLRQVLPAALQRAATEQDVVRLAGVRVRTNGDLTPVDLTIRPVPVGPSEAPEPTLYLVVLQESAAAGPLDAAAGTADPDASLAALRQELRSQEEFLQAANEELETTNEELRSSNEEMQSVNEELQSTNEELETSKEELQSVNEELATVNAELQAKVADLTRASNDMNNLLAGTGIATLFVDHQLRILRFTPAATRLINLIPSDVGRPVGHLMSNLVGYDHLVPDVQAVLDTLVPRELALETLEGRWYRMRIQPYRTLENVIEGAVISFFDVTEMKRTEAALREVQQQLGHGEGGAS